MGVATRSILLPYGGAVVFTALAVLLRRLLDPWLGDHTPFLTLLAAILFVAWYGGRGPALLSLIGGALAADYFLLHPRYSFAVEQPAFQVGLGVYAAVGGVSIFLFESVRKNQHRAESRQQQLEDEIAARRAAEKVLANREELLRTAFVSIGDAVVTTDAEGRITFLNPVAAELTGWTHQEASGQPLTTIFHIINETTRQPVENPVEEVLRSGKVAALANHTVLRSKDGVERPIDDSAAPIRDGNGRITGVVLIFRDVTQRRRAEQEILALNRDLNRRVTEFQALLDVLPVGIAVADDPHCRRIWSNPAMCRLLGVSPGANISLSAPVEERPRFKMYQDGRVLEPHELPMQIALARGQSISGVRQDLVFPDDTVVNLLQYAVPLRDEQGAIRGGLYVGVDVTRQERMRKALREAEQRWRTLTETLPNLIWTDLPNGQCDWLSSQWGKYTGIPENQLLGLRWLETVIHPDDRERTWACWQAACADKGDYDLEYRIRRHDGQYRWFKTRGVPIRDEQGKIVYWFGACTDIEDVKRLEAALREADRRKDEFLATLAHELRNPLAPLRNGLRILRLADDRASREQAREMMERQLAQLVRLVDDLLDVSRISRNKLGLRKARVSLASVIENAVETAHPLIDARGHTLTVLLPPEPIYLDGDLTRLAQVFWNLLSNSAKYTDPGGKIWLSAALEERDRVKEEPLPSVGPSSAHPVLGVPKAMQVGITVRDTGIGIPVEAQADLFTLFSQVDHSLERAQGGLGIGLALVKGLVEMHDGRIEVSSAGMGQGSTFTVHLPVAANPRPVDRPTERDGKDGAVRRRVLVVDDNRDAAASLAMMLSLTGHDIRTAHDGLQALELAEAFLPDMLLLDIGMPRLNGYDACRQIRRQPWGKNIVIVAVTGWGQEDDRRRSREAGFDHHLVKPVDPAAIEKLLAGLRASTL